MQAAREAGIVNGRLDESAGSTYLWRAFRAAQAAHAIMAASMYTASGRFGGGGG